MNKVIEKTKVMTVLHAVCQSAEFRNCACTVCKRGTYLNLTPTLILCMHIYQLCIAISELCIEKIH